MATYKKLLKNRAGDTIIPVSDYDVYSTSEKVVGVWTDGKPIYRVSVQKTISGSGWNSIITIANFSKLVKIEGSYIRNDNLWTDCPRSTIQIYIQNGNLQLKDTEGNGGTVYENIYYTKTTD